VSPRLSDLFLSSQSDERLVSLARAGHERAFAAIVERYRSELIGAARRLGADGRGEDVVQQAFLSAFAALRSGCEVKHLRGWLHQIVRHASSRERAPVLVPLDNATASAGTLEEIVQQRALALATLSELARLPARQRQAMVGTALDGLPRAEVASSMGLSEGAVRQLVHRARTSLRSAVTAITPWPLARWLATIHPPGGRAAELSTAAGTPGAAELAGGAGAVSSGGIAIKLGVVLASGTLATGIAAVDLHSTTPHRPVARAAISTHARAHRGRVAKLADARRSSPTGPGGSASPVAAVAVAVSLKPATPPGPAGRSDGGNGPGRTQTDGSGSGRDGALSGGGRRGHRESGSDGHEGTGHSSPASSGSDGTIGSGGSRSGSDGVDGQHQGGTGQSALAPSVPDGGQPAVASGVSGTDGSDVLRHDQSAYSHSDASSTPAAPSGADAVGTPSTGPTSDN
jgi:RNA polymerase sigma factor (sigma-70 family)